MAKKDDEVKSLKTSTDALKSSQDKLDESNRKLESSSHKLTTAFHGLRAASQISGEATELFSRHTAALINPETAAIAATATLALSFVALADKIAGAAVAVGKFVFESSNYARQNAILAEGLTGSAENGKAFTDQLNRLAEVVPTSKDELRTLGNELFKVFNNSAIDPKKGGREFVDAFNAIAQASSVAGKDAGKQLENLFARGRQFGRFRIAGNGLDELQGTGLNRDDVATQYAKRLKIGFDDARQRLASGRVDLEDGIRAVRDAVEQRYGPANTKLLKGWDVQVDKLKQSLKDIAGQIDFSPLLDALSEVRELFKEGTAESGALKSIIQGFGDLIGAPFRGGKVDVQNFIDIALLGFLKLETQVFKFIASLGGIKGISERLNQAFDWVSGVATNFERIYQVFSGIAQVASFALKSQLGGQGVIDLIGKGLSLEGDAIASAFQKLGLRAGDGLAEGLKASAPKANAASEFVMQGVILSSKDKAGIHSPSKVMQEQGSQLTAGLEKGIDKGSPNSGAKLMSAYLQPPNFGSGSAAPGDNSIGDVSVHVNAHFPNAKDGKEVASALVSSSFRAQLTKAIEEMLVGAAVPTQSGGI